MKRVGVFVGLLAAAVVAYLVWLFSVAGQFKDLEPRSAGQCLRVEGLVGVEDITVDPRSGLAYLSSADRRSVAAGGPARGGLYAYDLRAADPRPVPLTPDAEPGFHPHGISLWPGEGGDPDRLFVVNHPPGEHRIEVYDREGDRLVHRRTLRDPLLVSPNDISAVARDRFFVTNDHGSASGSPLRALEDYLQLPWANVLYHDGERFLEVAKGIAYANGINASRDGRELYVASPSTGTVLVYDRDGGSLALRERVDVGTGVDNIEIASDGALWIGAHPKLLDFVRHAGDASAPSPSEVVRVRVSDDAWQVEQFYLDLGEQLSGSSVAAVWRDRMLVGAVFDAAFLDCRIGDSFASGADPDAAR